VIALEMALVLMRGFRLTDARRCRRRWPSWAIPSQVLGIEIYTKYLYPLQVAAVLLLVAIIAAIALTLRAQGQRATSTRRAGAGAQGRPRAHGQDGARVVEAPRAAAAGRPREAKMTLGPITLGHYLSLGAILFALSVIGIFLNRKQPDRAADGHRADAAGRQPELRRLLALPG
jgi:hypothetical protein